MRAIFFTVFVATLVAADHRIEKRQAETCRLPSYPTYGTYTVAGNPSAKPGDELNFAYINVTCSKGYSVMGTNNAVCVSGKWLNDKGERLYEFPKCEVLCHLPKHISVDYLCLISGSDGTRTCKEYELPGAVVKPVCKRPNYYSPIDQPNMRCVDGSWDYVAVCTPECGLVTPTGETLVSGGRQAMLGELPWHAAVYRKNNNFYIFMCAGSLVSNTVVISVAHCYWDPVNNKVQPASLYAVGLGKIYSGWNDLRDKDAQQSAVKDIKIPPRFQGSRTNFQDDLAILILKTPIVYKTFIRPVCMSFDYVLDKKQLQDGKLGKISGWGLTSASGDTTSVLKTVELPYLSIDQCLSKVPQQFYEYITGDKICAGYTNGTALCKGDTGGGLVFPEYERGVVRHYLRGIASTAPTNDNYCNVDTIVAFTHVLKHESFIKDVQNDCANGWDPSDLRCKKVVPNSPATSNRPALTGKCLLPQYPDHGTYEVRNVPFAGPGQRFTALQLNVTCKPGYGLTDNPVLFCQDGAWSGSLPKCIRHCKLAKNPSVQYHCLVPGDNAALRDCNDFEPAGTIVSPACNAPHYYTSYDLPYMRCIDGNWDYVAVCTPECGKVTPEGVVLVSGGETAMRGEIPWHVGIYRKGKKDTYTQICGGSLVSPTVVISAAHCFWKDVGKQQPASDYAVATGKLYRDWDDERDVDAQKSLLKALELPRRFLGRENNFQEDIAILIVATPFVYHNYIRPVCLNFDYNFDRRQLQQDRLGKVAGWGLTTENGNSSNILKVVELPYVDIDKCIKTLPLAFRENITGDKICAGYTNGTAPCRGDSGGGLAFPAVDRGVDRFFLRGIVSVAPNNAKECNAFTLTAFTHIMRHEHFIKKFLWS